MLAHARQVVDRGRAAHAEWDEKFAAWAAENPDAKALLDRMSTRTLPDGWTKALPEFPADAKGMATRKASGNVLEKIAPVLPELWGGSADLAESNNTTPKGEPSFLPEDRQSKEFPGGPYGRVLHFGIREHAMGSIMNGIALHGGTRVYGGTFLVFSDYMRPAVRLAALMKLPVTYVWTHDSIGLGEDGPTHQPIEHLAALRAIPGLDVVRPADANETVVAWRTILEHTDRPAGLCLTRQDVPDLGPVGVRLGRRHGPRRLRPRRRLRRPAAGDPGRHRLRGAARVAARETLEAEGTPTRVVSMPCVEWFHEQDTAYQQQVLPSGVKARVSVEAAVGDGLARHRRRRRRDREHRALRRQRGAHRALRAVRLHPRPGRRRRARLARAGRRHHRQHDRQLT